MESVGMEFALLKVIAAVNLVGAAPQLTIALELLEVNSWMLQVLK
jgi:hypothetical protein